MNDTTRKYVFLAIRALLTLAFLGAGLAKLMGVEMLVQEFDTLGLGQWFRYVTGIIEVAAAVIIWLPGYTAVGAGLMVCVTIGALIAHATKLGLATAPPAFVLLVLAAITLYFNRDQLKRFIG